MSKCFIHELSNGLTLLGEPMENVASAAMTMLIPGGSAHDPAPLAGSASVACEWIFRGAGGRDSRQLNDALDALGCQHSENVLSEHMQFSTAQLGRNLPAVLEIYADILRRPQLQDATFDPCRALTLQDLASLEDEPSRKCVVLLREKFYPWPLGRNVYGREETLAALTPEAVRRHTLELMTPQQAILAVAGNIDWGVFCSQCEKLLGDWQGPWVNVPPLAAPDGGTTFIQKDSAQVQIALANRSVPASHRQYYAARMAESILSGGMSSRLITEVRDKRGLVYSVSSRYHTLKQHAGLFTTAGTTPSQAPQTLAVIVQVLRDLARGVHEDELKRSRTQLKSSLVMQGESSTSRAGALVGDWFHLRRVRTLEELSAAIDNVTAQDVLDHLQQCPADGFTVLLIGPEPLDVAAILKSST